MECYVDAEFAGGWREANADDADNVMSRIGMVIMYANCPVFWRSSLQTEIALSTAGAEYIALSSTLRQVLPMMTMMEEGLECYVDADFAGGWQEENTDNADNVMSRTGMVIMYANCPIFWHSSLQTEIALSTAGAEYIALSSTLRQVLPMMNSDNS